MADDDAERAGAAAPGVLALRERLHALEVGQHVRVGPALGALALPAVVVAAVAAHVGHHVDRGRAAEHLAAHRLDLAAAHVRLGLVVVAPVEHLVVVQLAEPQRDLDVGVIVGARRPPAAARCWRRPPIAGRRARSPPIPRRR